MYWMAIIDWRLMMMMLWDCDFPCIRSLSKTMNSSSTQFVPSRMMGIYESIHQMGMWEDNFKPSMNPLAPPPLIIEAYQNHLDNQVLTLNSRLMEILVCFFVIF